MSFQVGCDM